MTMSDMKCQSPNKLPCNGSGDDLSGQNNNHQVEKNMTSHETLSITVSGITYEVDVQDVRRAPYSRIYREVMDGKKNCLTYKRPTSSFEAVLAFYQTGELHMPTSVCPGAFKTELDFWELDPQKMSKCCYYRLLSHADDMETLDKFHKHLFPEPALKSDNLCLAGVRSSIWGVLDFNQKSWITTVYFWICTIMVVISVMTLALSSLPAFRRNLTKCELEEYLGRQIDTVSGQVPEDGACAEPLSDEVYSKVIVDYNSVIVKNKTDIDENDISVTPKTHINTVTGGTVTNATYARMRSVFDFIFPKAVSDDKLIEQMLQAISPNVGIIKKTVRIQTLVYLDTVALAFFSVDLLLRILCCPSLKSYFLSTINVIDALTVLSAYAHMAVNFLIKTERYDVSNFDLLELLQCLRVVRLLRIVRDVMGFKVLSFSLRVSCKDLLVLLLYMILGVVIFANFVFFVESESEIDSIPVGWWWAICTLTTVGYGDVRPTTLYGRIIGGICAISGVVMMAVAIPVFVKTFILLYAYAVLYKKSLSRPEDTHRFIQRHGRQNAAQAQNHSDRKM